MFDRPDNVTVTPWGQLILCEDGNDAQYLILCEPNTGELWPFAHNAMNDNEFAGANFSPDGKTLFVNVQNPSTTLAITGPTRVRALMRNVAATSATVHRHHTEKPEPRNRRLLRSPACPKDPSSSSSCS